MRSHREAVYFMPDGFSFSLEQEAGHLLMVSRSVTGSVWSLPTNCRGHFKGWGRTLDQPDLSAAGDRKPCSNGLEPKRKATGSCSGKSKVRAASRSSNNAIRTWFLSLSVLCCLQFSGVTAQSLKAMNSFSWDEVQ